jgi:hypothetical protein
MKTSNTECQANDYFTDALPFLYDPFALASSEVWCPFVKRAFPQQALNRAPFSADRMDFLLRSSDWRHDRRRYAHLASSD